VLVAGGPRATSCWRLLGVGSALELVAPEEASDDAHGALQERIGRTQARQDGGGSSAQRGSQLASGAHSQRVKPESFAAPFRGEGLSGVSGERGCARDSSGTL